MKPTRTLSGAASPAPSPSPTPNGSIRSTTTVQSPTPAQTPVITTTRRASQPQQPQIVVAKAPTKDTIAAAPVPAMTAEVSLSDLDNDDDNDELQDVNINNENNTNNINNANAVEQVMLNVDDSGSRVVLVEIPIKQSDLPVTQRGFPKDLKSSPTHWHDRIVGNVNDRPLILGRFQPD